MNNKNSEIFVIAEIAQAHEGSLGIAHAYIDALAHTGVNAVKFQTHIAEAESSVLEPFRVNFSYEDKTRFDYWKRMEFTNDQWMGLKLHCDDRGLEFISSPFSIAAVEMIECIGVKRYKIGSGEMNNYLMLHRIAQTGKPIILSSGMSDYKELDATINYLKPFGNELSLLQCNTAYPTPPEKWGLFEMQRLRERYHLKTGYSDHSSDVAASTAAAALGAEIIEFHVVFDKRMFGPDSKASLLLDEVSSLVKNIRNIECCRNNDKSKEDASEYDELKVMFGKSLSLNKSLKKGHRLQINDLESKKPGNAGIPASEFKQVLGKALVRDVEAWEFLTINDINL
jgi:N,N'-diacetyllegionaminate synthase